MLLLYCEPEVTEEENSARMVSIDPRVTNSRQFDNNRINQMPMMDDILSYSSLDEEFKHMKPAKSRGRKSSKSGKIDRLSHFLGRITCNCSDYFIFSPKSLLFRVYLVFIVFLRIVSSLFYMGFAAYRKDVQGGHIVLHPAYYAETLLTPEEVQKMRFLELAFESIFCIDMLTNFFKEYQTNEDSLPVRSLERISRHYLQGQFIFDCIPLIPYSLMFEFKYCRLLYFLKSIRIFKSIEMLSDKVFMKELNDYNRARMVKCCQDPLIANDIIEDHSQIMRTLIIIYAFKISKLIMVILFTTYFIGVVFYIYCDITNDDVDAIYNEGTFGEHFIEHFQLNSMHPTD
jgi:hypothetical protein